MLFSVSSRFSVEEIFVAILLSEIRVYFDMPTKRIAIFMSR